MHLNLQQQVPLCRLSTFKIGGPARYYLEAGTVQEIQQALAWCQSENIPYFIVGKGSNCLFDDRGFNGLILRPRLEAIEDEGAGLFRAGAGASFSRLGTLTARGSWAGLEFASGIPGSVGGAVYMNAGANGRETADSLVWVEYLHEDGRLARMERSDLSFSYRSSPFQSMRGCILAAGFQCGFDSEARARQIQIIQQRKASQPLAQPSAGCVFRNPPSGSAGAMIDRLGLKGLRIGDAEVSTVHGNFLVNRGQATAADVKALAEAVQQRVKEETGEDLHMEIYHIPYEGRS